MHHLNCKRDDNRKENLIVLERGQHTKLHNWINIGATISNSNGKDDSEMNFCALCGLTLNKSQIKYCSDVCYRKDSFKIDWPSDDKLRSLIKEHKNFSELGRILGVSATSIKNTELYNNWRNNENF